jgi:hypothetical protein
VGPQLPSAGQRAFGLSPRPSRSRSQSPLCRIRLNTIELEVKRISWSPSNNLDAMLFNRWLRILQRTHSPYCALLKKTSVRSEVIESATHICTCDRPMTKSAWLAAMKPSLHNWLCVCKRILHYNDYKRQMRLCPTYGANAHGSLAYSMAGGQLDS